MAKYDHIGLSYNQTRKADPYLVSRMMDLLNPTDEEHYLDIGCGTGNYTLELAKAQVHLIGIDPSEKMLSKARSRNASIEWRLGVAEEIPLADNSMDGVLAWLTTHHWSDIPAGFAEINRVLRPGGRLLIFTSTPEQMEGYWLHHYFPMMMKESGEKMQSEDSLKKMLDATELMLEKSEPYVVREDLQDLFLQCGKYNPEIYFRPEIRQGISSFSSVAHFHEVETGLTVLRRDIDSNNFQGISEKYDASLGDYLFILARKRE